jgi:hypothetical protein
MRQERRNKSGKTSASKAGEKPCEIVMKHLAAG